MITLKGRVNTFVLLLGWATTAVVLPAQTFKTLHSFDNTDGAYPSAALLQDTDGNLYGTAAGGGNLDNNVGTIFRITPSGTLTTLYIFCSQFNCTDGNSPSAAMIQGADGNLYGTTYYGGARGEGTVFKFTSSATVTTLHSFCTDSGCTDGDQPSAALVQAESGDFYGTTQYGGADGAGEVFKITPSGTLTVLQSFNDTNGDFPYAGLVLANDGDFYGTAGYGGASFRYGTAYEITPGGDLTTLHSFEGTDGSYVIAGLVQGSDGNFYGATSEGGTDNAGTIFKLTPSGTLTTLHNFDVADGWFPYAALVQGTDGNFYGTTYQGGANNDGTIFKITSSGALTTLHNFDGRDGENPYASLVEDTNGTFYGTTVHGGFNGLGTVFSLDVGLGPFVETEPTSGSVGKSVKILGTNLTGATSVTFDGAPAVFTVVSSSLITTNVPAGATSGKVQVVTTGGKLTSNVSFHVSR